MNPHTPRGARESMMTQRFEVTPQAAAALASELGGTTKAVRVFITGMG